MSRAKLERRLEILEARCGRSGQAPPSAADWDQVERELSAPALEALHNLLDSADGSELTEEQEMDQLLEVQVILTMDAPDLGTLARWTRLLQITSSETEETDLPIDAEIRKLIASRSSRRSAWENCSLRSGPDGGQVCGACPVLGHCEVPR